MSKIGFEVQKRLHYKKTAGVTLVGRKAYRKGTVDFIGRTFHRSALIFDGLTSIRGCGRATATELINQLGGSMTARWGTRDEDQYKLLVSKYVQLMSTMEQKMRLDHYSGSRRANGFDRRFRRQACGLPAGGARTQSNAHSAKKLNLSRVLKFYHRRRIR